MALNGGKMYPILEHPAEDVNERNYCEIPLPVKSPSISKVIKKVSSASLPERQYECIKNDLNHKGNSIPTLITTEVEDQQIEDTTGSKTSAKNANRLSVSLTDFSNIGLAPDSETSNSDKKEKNAFANTALSSSHTISETNSRFYLEVQDCISHSNDEPEYETLLSPKGLSTAVTNQESNEVNFNHGDRRNKDRKDSENLVVIDFEDENEKKGQQATENQDGPSVPRQRSCSMQWIQNTFQNVSNKYRHLLEFRRPSDIVEERMRKSQEELEMKESESDVTTTEKLNPTTGGRRYSEDVIGKQKRLPFATRLEHLKDLWKDRNVVAKRQEEKDIDQTRTDVCPLFTFPRKRDEDEQILDALRQAMRKCTAVDPTSRPTSTTVLEQLSKLIDESMNANRKSDATS